MLLALREALQKPPGSLTSTQVSISENWFMMGKMTSMELPICRSDLFPTKIMGILGKKDRVSERMNEATPLVLPGSRLGSLPTLLCKVHSSFPASHGWEHPSGETDCLIPLTLSPSNNMFRSL